MRVISFGCCCCCATFFVVIACCFPLTLFFFVFVAPSIWRTDTVPFSLFILKAYIYTFTPLLLLLVFKPKHAHTYIVALQKLSCWYFKIHAIILLPTEWKAPFLLKCYPEGKTIHFRMLRKRERTKTATKERKNKNTNKIENIKNGETKTKALG